ncbi:MAG: RNA polymerase subunit sigma [Blastopirellula sp.]|nr:MAG: RNA polymerase subunit sigma [Blastopirellula sp.]
MEDNQQPDPTTNPEQFIELLAEHDHALTSFVMSLIPGSSDAQDILQETKMALWRSFDKFQPGSNFRAWARQTALNRVLNFRRRKAQENERLWFTEKCYELLATEFDHDAQRREDQAVHLRKCITKLPTEQQRLLTLRYFHDSTVEDIAAKVERTVQATYRALSRIRLSLRNCIHQEVRHETRG